MRRDRLVNACDKRGKCDPVDACGYAKLLKECKALCAEDSKCAAGPVFGALKEALRTRHKQRSKR